MSMVTVLQKENQAHQTRVKMKKFTAFIDEARRMKGKDPCWDGYHMVGTKKKNGKEVPNCVPDTNEAVFVATMKQGTSKQAYLGAKAKCPTCGESKNKDTFKMYKGKEMCSDCRTEAEEEESEKEDNEKEDNHREMKEERALGKPYRTPGGPKKFAVHVKNEKGNVVKVTFGDPNLSIKRDSPERRKAFRARHNCADPGPRTKARYWSCRQWRASAKVEA